MPNWCYNQLSVTGDHKSLTKFKKQAASLKGENVLQFGAFIPMPKELDYDENNNMSDAQKASNLKKYGFEDWYNWRVQNWGTKWDIECDYVDETSKGDDNLGYSFDTAWAPPFAWLQKVSEMFPSLEFEMHYEEAGMCFRGAAVANNGELDEGDEEWKDTCDNCGDDIEGESHEYSDGLCCDNCWENDIKKLEGEQ